MNLEWLGTVLLGLFLTFAPAKLIFLPSRLLRSSLWLAVLSSGSPAIIPLRFVSWLVIVAASLPFLATLFANWFAAADFDARQFTLIATLVVFRTLLFPAFAMNWSNIRIWEQEIVRPAGTSTLPSLLDGFFDRTPNAIRERLWRLSRKLAFSETTEAPVLKGIPTRATGLLLLHLAAQVLPSNLNSLRPELTLWVVTLTFYLTLSELYPEKIGSKVLTSLTLTVFPSLALSVVRSLLSPTATPLLLKTQTLANIEVLSVTIFLSLLFMRNLGRVFVDTNGGRITPTSIPVGHRFFFLRKLTHIGKWLANPGNFLTLLMQTDVLVATLRISIS